MNPRLRQVVIALAASASAVWLAWLAAEGSYTLPALAGVIALAAILVRLMRLPADVILLGLLLVGYIVGNRGFAQLMPLPGLPLFPAECGLALGLGWLVVQSALRRTAPWRNDALNRVVLLWLAVGTARLAIDLHRYGLFAVRDYAMIYYAAFFFLAQRYAADARSRHFLVVCAGTATAVLLPVYFLFLEYPGFFLTRLTVQGVPLIYLKGDLAATFLGVGAVIIFHGVRGRNRLWGWPLAIGMFLTVAAGENRASLVGVFVAMGWLLLGRRWAFPAVQLGTAAAGLLLMLTLAYSGNVPWAAARLAGMKDRVTSIVDLRSSRAYDTAESALKGDNNRFRLIWWRTVVEDTWHQGPAFGLGFGYDLAENFLQAYDPAIGEDFTARSPHSIVIGTFGRMGGVGLAVLLAIAGVMARQTWRALRNPASGPLACSLWCAAWVVFISACFGVVLEGPMGAVIFWSLLGLANGIGAADAAPEGPGTRSQVTRGQQEATEDSCLPAGRSP